MQIIVSGKHMDTGDSFKVHAEKRLQEGINKYIDRISNVNVVVGKEAHNFRVDITANSGTHDGFVVRGRADSGDVYSAFDGAAEKIEKQLRRYKRRLTNHHALPVSGGDIAAAHKMVGKKYVISDREEQEASDAPVIIAEKATDIEKLSVSEAVMKMDLSDLPALMFINSSHGRVNVVYRRQDGHISWVDPADSAAA